VPVVAHAARGLRGSTGARRVGLRLLMAWSAAWIVPFALSATKLPGYVWPAYPALACLTGLFLADWTRQPSAADDRWMRTAWGFLAGSGVILAIGVGLTFRRLAPGGEWLGLVGLLPLAGGMVALAWQRLGSRIAAAAAWGITACGTVGLLLAIGPAVAARGSGPGALLALVDADGARQPPLAIYRAPPSAAFYAGRLSSTGSVPDLREPRALARFLADHPGAYVVLDSRFVADVRRALPRGYAVLHSVDAVPAARRLLLVGPDPPNADRHTSLIALQPGGRY